MLDVSRVLGAGAKKYGSKNWKLITIKEHLDHLLTHVLAYLEGDGSDSHLTNAACRSLMALQLQLEGQDRGITA